MLLAEEMANFLQQDTTLAFIDFHLEGLHVTGRDIARVGAALREGRIIPIVDASLSLNCLYAKDTDAMCVPRGVNLRNEIFRASLVHESVHAACDMNRCVGTSPLSEEVACYLAQVIYLRKKSGHTLTLSAVEPGERDILVEANRLVEAHHLDYRRGVGLGFTDYAALRPIIGRHPLYFHMVGRRRAPANNAIRPRI